jgi:uncharacterized protein YigE (DUF2233 family)
MTQARQYFFILCLYLIVHTAWADNPTVWRTLAPGLSYTQITGFPNFPAGQVHAFRIDLQRYQLKSVLFPPFSGFSKDRFLRLLVTEQAAIGSNGGFFTPELKPLGLRITDNQILNPLRPTLWWGIFLIQDKKPQIIRQAAYQPKKSTAFAIQAGPILVQDEKIRPKSSQKIEERTAIGITAHNDIVLVATENLLLSARDLATLLQRPLQAGGLACVDALNLDGGHSTQLYATLPNFSLQITSSTPVSDALLVVPIPPNK